MLDNRLRPYLSPLLDQLGQVIARSGISANQVTVASFVAGIMAALAVALQAYEVGLVLLLISRMGDGLDGAVARATRKTDFGGYLDIVLDFAFYGAIPLGFVFADANANAVAGAVLLVSFYVNGASFLAFAIMMEKNGLSDADLGSKSLFFSTGLAEATETYAIFVAACLFPAWFPLLAYGFAALCFYTALSRLMRAGRVFTR